MSIVALAVKSSQVTTEFMVASPSSGRPPLVSETLVISIVGAPAACTLNGDAKIVVSITNVRIIIAVCFVLISIQGWQAVKPLKGDQIQLAPYLKCTCFQLYNKMNQKI